MTRFFTLQLSRAAALFALLLTTAAGTALAQSEDSHTGANRITLSYETLHSDWTNLMGMSKTLGIGAAYTRRSTIVESLDLALEYGGKVAWLHKIENKPDFEVERNTYLYASLPLNVTKAIEIGNTGLKVSPLFGLNFKFNIIGNFKEKSKRTGYETKTNYLDRENKNAANIFQLGMNVGVGATFRRLYVGFTFQPDFTKYIAKDEFASRCKTRATSLSVGWTF